ncbi:PadR family transcriptional regulator [Haloarchaeobius litoreus]|uniref:PadR family transcriptional regulator n=1 Tax=Haloarchaeobius litoreus TaxID=755306 RepID=A0ABD6DCR7_9EURY|nr:helix-turn-helix transcriptional regulator [Haloarchaeobius litoreus]
MRNNKDTSSVFSDLTAAATDDDSGEQYELTIGSAEKVDEKSVERELDEMLESVEDALPTDEAEFDEEIIKENLDEVLLMLISLRGETHGKELISDLTRLFGAQLSPGTVYPGLHKLEEDDVLHMHKKVRTKEYSIEDEREVRTSVERTMLQHLAFGYLLYSFLPRL